MAKARGQLAIRAASAAVLMPVTIALAWQGGPLFSAAVAAFVALALWEFRGLARAVGWPFATVPAVVLGLGLALGALAPVGRYSGVYTLAIVLYAASSLALRIAQRQHQGRFVGWAIGAAAAAYIGGLASFLTHLREFSSGFTWLLLAFASTWAYDTGAYFAGTVFGRHPFMSYISPNKTWEGVAGGLAACLACVAAFIPFLPIAPWQAPIAGLFFATAAQTGDVVESALKREAGAKDSGGIVPGHGGILDRVDSLLFTGLAVYTYASLVTGSGPFS